MKDMLEIWARKLVPGGKMPDARCQMLDIEGDDPTWNGVQRNASGAVPEGKLTVPV